MKAYLILMLILFTTFQSYSQKTTSFYSLKQEHYERNNGIESTLKHLGDYTLDYSIDFYENGDVSFTNNRSKLSETYKVITYDDNGKDLMLTIVSNSTGVEARLRTDSENKTFYFYTLNKGTLKERMIVFKIDSSKIHKNKLK